MQEAQGQSARYWSGIGMEEMEADLLREQFGPDRYISCKSAEELPEKVGAILRSVRRS